jgi:chromosome segregation ATPase
MVSGQPRALHRFLIVRSVVAAIAFFGCVPAAHYEEAQSAAQVAEEAQRRTSARLAEVEAELERLKVDHARAQQRLGSYDQAVSEAELERVHLEKQRDEHAELVTTLRGELARVGDHLRIYSEDRTELGERLELAQGELERLAAELDRLRAGQEPPSAGDEPKDATPRTSDVPTP